MQCFLLAQILSPLRAIAAAAACCSFSFPLPPSHTRTHIRLLVVRVFPFAGHLLSSFAFALRRIASFCLRDNKHHKSFFLPNGTPRPAPLPLPLYHYWLPLPLCIFVSVSLSSFRAAPLEPFRRRRQLAASVTPLFVFVFRLGHRLLLFAVCWPLCRTALCRTGQRHISTHTLCLPLAARPLGPSAQAAAGSVSFLRFARFTALPAALTDCIWQRLKIVVETSLLRRPFPAAVGLFIFVISLLRRSLNG